MKQIKVGDYLVFDADPGVTWTVDEVSLRRIELWRGDDGATTHVLHRMIQWDADKGEWYVGQSIEWDWHVDE